MKHIISSFLFFLIFTLNIFPQLKILDKSITDNGLMIDISFDEEPYLIEGSNRNVINFFNSFNINVQSCDLKNSKEPFCSEIFLTYFRLGGAGRIGDKLKLKIKNHRITTKTKFLGPTHKLFGKKNLEQFWSKFAPPKFLLVEYLRVTL